MKKAKLIGALLAAVIAAAPATGLAGNVLSFNDNAIVAEAKTLGYSLIMVDSGNYKRTELFSFDLSTKEKTIIMKNGDWSLVAEPSGKLYTYNSKTKKVGKWLNDFAYVGKKYPGTNDTIRNLRIAFQTDGNIVMYAVCGKTSRPLYHSHTYSQLTVDKGDCIYYYFFDADGTLRALRIYSGGKYDEVFNSKRNNFFRIV